MSNQGRNMIDETFDFIEDVIRDINTSENLFAAIALCLGLVGILVSS